PLVGKFVKQQFSQFRFAVIDKSTEQGVFEPAERGVGINAVYIDIESFFCQTAAVVPGALFRKIAAIGEAPDEGIPPGFRLQGKLRGGLNVPDDRLSINIDVLVVVALHRKLELAFGERADLPDEL